MDEYPEFGPDFDDLDTDRVVAGSISDGNYLPPAVAGPGDYCSAVPRELANQRIKANENCRRSIIHQIIDNCGYRPR